MLVNSYGLSKGGLSKLPPHTHTIWKLCQCFSATAANKLDNHERVEKVQFVFLGEFLPCVIAGLVLHKHPVLQSLAKRWSQNNEQS